jgi:hypothetical protein
MLFDLISSTGPILGSSWHGMACEKSAKFITSSGTWFSGTTVVSAGLHEWFILAHEVKYLFTNRLVILLD